MKDDREVCFLVSQLSTVGGAERLLMNAHKEIGGVIATPFFHPEKLYPYFARNSDSVEQILRDREHHEFSEISLHSETARPHSSKGRFELYRTEVERLLEEVRAWIEKQEIYEFVPMDALSLYLLPEKYREKAFAHCTFRIFTDLRDITVSNLSEEARESYRELEETVGKEVENAASDYSNIYVNSKYVKSTFQEYYGVDAEVLNPGVDLGRFKPDKGYDEYFLSVQRLHPNKRIDIQLKAFSQMPDRKLVVVGKGPEEDYVQKVSKRFENIVYKGEVSNQELIDLYSNARATIQTCYKEDFGLVPIESMACGTPVIVTDMGGFRHTVDEKTGEKIDLSSESLKETVRSFERQDYSPGELREKAMNYSKEKMGRKMRRRLI